MNRFLRALTVVTVIAGIALVGSTPTEAATVRPTVVLVHGFTAEALPNWAVMGPGLAAAGFQTQVYRYPSTVVGAQAAAQALGATVSALAVGGRKVALIGHSEGGLVTKACIIEAACRGKVSHWFNISGVNNGTLISAGIPGTALGDMGTTSVIVNRLKAENGIFRQQGIKCTVAWTATDGLVYPPTASLEPSLGCGSVNVVGANHFTIISDPRTVAAAIQLLNR
jgi:triacylglycerol lipase